MAVGVEGHSDGRVPHDDAKRLRVHARRDEQRRASVPRLVQSDRREQPDTRRVVRLLCAGEITADELVKRADGAMYLSKDQRHGLPVLENNVAGQGFDTLQADRVYAPRGSARPATPDHGQPPRPARRARS
jgi:hypothetical protein